LPLSYLENIRDFNNFKLKIIDYKCQEL
jgi:hypothetical protein